MRSVTEVDAFPLKGKESCSNCDTAYYRYLASVMEGDLDTVASQLNEMLVHVNVADKNGHTALLGAAVSTCLFAYGLCTCCKVRV